MKIVPGETYKDVNSQDFTHYFRGTAMVLNLGNSAKKRVFLPQSSDGDKVTGIYLTREKVFKDTVLAFSSWWTKMGCIPPTPIGFNIANGAVYYQVSLNKNLKKSLPWTPNELRVFGSPAAEEVTLQASAYNLFRDLYEEPVLLPTLGRALKDTKREATYCRGGALIDRKKGAVLLKGKNIGTVDGPTISLLHNYADLIPLLKILGAENINVLPVPPPEPKTEESPAQRLWKQFAEVRGMPTDLQIATKGGYPGTKDLWRQHLEYVKAEKLSKATQALSGAYTNQVFGAINTNSWASNLFSSSPATMSTVPGPLEA